MLDLSRAMSGKILLSRQPVEVSAMVSACLDTFRATGRTGNYQLNLSLTHGWVDGDPTRLEQIATNLIDNALKYTPPGGVIDIAVHEEGEDVVLTVRDTGVGISEELLPHVFDVFVQASTTLDRSQGGLGIGLALVRRLVELHGGTVSAESDGAAAVAARLPSACRARCRSRWLEVRTSSPADAGKPSVLLIEDNDDGREMMATMLDACGYPVEHAADGLQGVQMALAHCPDVALVDIGLPGIDGYEVARRLRANEGTRGIKLIALTGYGLAEDQRRVLDAGYSTCTWSSRSTSACCSKRSRNAPPPRPPEAGAHGCPRHRLAAVV
ncbi:hybrid sensor histidine kinase/response regulator [Massilia sp. H-1]|nr:hybrid sensor histidine kinase/response regulator [Massilia sp. H-1]